MAQNANVEQIAQKLIYGQSNCDRSKYVVTEKCYRQIGKDKTSREMNQGT